MEFDVDSYIYLKVSPVKGDIRFVKKGKLRIMYINPYRISKRISNVAYKLELPSKLATFHLYFIFICRKVL